jgi:DNA damage-binding protein 1
MDLEAVGGINSTTTHEEGSSSSSNLLLLPAGKSRIMAVGTWVDHSVSLLALPGLEKISTTSLGVDVQSRDILLISIEDMDYLMIGMGDGSLITFIVEYEAGLPVLTGRRKFIIGTHPISFSCFINHENLCVFASCDRSTVIYSRNSKLLFSVVNVPECTGMAPFHSNFFPNCLAISSESGFMIGAVDNIQKIHIQSFYIHQSPKRICHCDISGIYAVLCQKIIEKDKEELSSSILFLSESMDEVIIY